MRDNITIKRLENKHNLVKLSISSQLWLTKGKTGREQRRIIITGTTGVTLCKKYSGYLWQEKQYH